MKSEIRQSGIGLNIDYLLLISSPRWGFYYFSVEDELTFYGLAYKMETHRVDLFVKTCTYSNLAPIQLGRTKIRFIIYNCQFFDYP